MAVSYVGTSTASHATENVNFTIDAVAGTADGDILIMTCQSYYSGTPTLPAGWTKFIDNEADGATSVWWKRASSEGATYTIDPNVGASCQITVWRGCVTSGNPYDDTDMWNDGASGTTLRSVLEPSEAGTMGVVFGRCDTAAGPTVTPASGWTEIVDRYWADYGQTFWMAYKELASSGSTGNIDSTLSASKTGRYTVAFCLKAAPAAGGVPEHSDYYRRRRAA